MRCLGEIGKCILDPQGLNNAEKPCEVWSTLRVVGSGVCMSINDMEGLRRTMFECLYADRNSCSRYLWSSSFARVSDRSDN